MSTAPPANLIWLDCEFTGLDPDINDIIEVAAIVTDGELNILDRGPDLVIFQPDDRLDRMDDWAREHHTASGLLGRVRASTVSLTEAEAALLAFTQRWAVRRTAPLCGNSIWQDRRFLCRHMPSFEDYLLHRNIDVSSVREIAKRWYPAVIAQQPKPDKAHLALADIEASIAELAWYREHVFRTA